jgi:hypothetical protein
MNDFQPIIDHFTQLGDTPVLETNHGETVLTWQHTQDVPVTTDIEVIVSPWGTQWGGTILTTDNHPEWGKGRETEESLTFDTQPELIQWLDRRLRPTERDLNNAWGV